MLLNFILGRVGKSLVDNVIRDRVIPVPGSLVYCDLALNLVEHTGIYLGNNEIAHLDGNGTIEIVTPRVFIDRLGGFNTAVTIYVSCRNGHAVGCAEVAQRAKDQAWGSRDYNFLLDNCHQFSSGCLSGNFENPHNFFWMVKSEAEKTLGANEWRAWETENGFHLWE